MALVALGKLRGDEGARRAGDDLVHEAALQLFEERRVAGDRTRFEKRRPESHVVARGLERLVDRARPVPDLQPQIPEHVEDVFGHALRPCRLLPRKQEEEVEVGEGGERSPPVAADRDQRQALGGGGVAGRKDMCGGEVEERFDDRVGKRGEALGGVRPVPVLLEAAADDQPAILQHLAQELQHRLAPRRRRRAVPRGDGGELGTQPPFIDRALGYAQPLHRIRFRISLRIRVRLA